MKEASKTKALWNEKELALLNGKGIDIGAGDDPITNDVRIFDLQHGDANYITKYVDEQFDYVFSAHCLEHMFKPAEALNEWWQLVKPGGHLIFIVPDEDLYEQGYFPSMFNTDHKATFTISKRASWSPVSYNVIDLVKGLKDSELIDIQLHDIGYDRKLIVHKLYPRGAAFFFIRVRNKLVHILNQAGIKVKMNFLTSYFGIPADQTKYGALAQIQAVVRKKNSDD